MAFDAHKNFAITTVVTAPSPATSGTTLVVTTGEGARFPAVPFNATVWPASQIPTPGTAEVVRVTARTSDTLTITRAQESSTARSIVAGDLISATITVKTITDLEAGTNFSVLAAESTGEVFSSLTPATTGGRYLAVSNTSNSLFCGVDNGSATHFSTVANAGVLYANGAAGLSVVSSAGPTRFYTNGTTERMRLHYSGGLSLGTTTDPGTGIFLVQTGITLVAGATLLQGTFGANQNFFYQNNGAQAMGLVGTGGVHIGFWNASGNVGSITSSGTTVTYSSVSDARLKRDHGPHTDLEVLRRTVVHRFDWVTDGTAGRGVFAQEAQTVAPFAVTVGTDDRDAEGRLTSPWGVDYSKYVPDLLAGWQAHAAQIAALEDRCAALEARLAALTLPPTKD